MKVLRKQESPADRILPVCSGFPTSRKLVGLDRLPTYFGGVAPEDEAIAELLLPSADGAAGAMVELLLPSGAGVVAAGGAGAAAGGVFSVLLQAESTSAAAKALRPSFVFIDESPELFERSGADVSCRAQNNFIGRCDSRGPDSIDSPRYFKLGSV
jgi:hypothetical protein